MATLSIADLRQAAQDLGINPDGMNGQQIRDVVFQQIPLMRGLLNGGVNQIARQNQMMGHQRMAIYALATLATVTIPALGTALYNLGIDGTKQALGFGDKTVTDLAKADSKALAAELSQCKQKINTCTDFYKESEKLRETCLQEWQACVDLNEKYEQNLLPKKDGQ